MEQNFNALAFQSAPHNHGVSMAFGTMEQNLLKS